MNTQFAIIAAISAALLSCSIAGPAPKGANPPSNADGGQAPLFREPPLVLPKMPSFDKDLGVKSRVLSVSKDQSLVAVALAEYPKAASGHGAIASRALPFPINLTPMSLSSGDGKKPPRVLDHIAVFAVEQIDPDDSEKVQLRLVRYALARPGVMSLYLLVPPDGRPTGLVILYADKPFVEGANPEDVLDRLKGSGKKPDAPKDALPKKKSPPVSAPKTA